MFLKENIKAKASHDSIKKLFEKFGTVSYVSLPKFKSTNTSKGFAFVEFSTKDEAKKAIEVIAGFANLKVIMLCFLVF